LAYADSHCVGPGNRRADIFVPAAPRLCGTLTVRPQHRDSTQVSSAHVISVPACIGSAGKLAAHSFVVSALDLRAGRCLQRGNRLYFIALGVLERRPSHAVSLARWLTINCVSSKCVCCRLQCSLSPLLFPWTCRQSPENGPPLLKAKPDGMPATERQG